MTRLGVVGILILHFSLLILPAFGQVITTVAGGQWVFRGDGGRATGASVGEIGALAVDSAGNVFVADFGNNLVFKISPSGVLTVVAGNGLFGLSGDGGAATAAALNIPAGVAVDSSGNLYISDQANQRIRKVAANGIITTLVGSGPTGAFEGGFSGDGGPATSARLNWQDI